MSNSSIDLAELCAATKQHGFVEFVPQDFEDLQSAFFADDTLSPQNRPARQSHTRPKAQPP